MELYLDLVNGSAVQIVFANPFYLFLLWFRYMNHTLEASLFQLLATEPSGKSSTSWLGNGRFV